MDLLQAAAEVNSSPVQQVTQQFTQILEAPAGPAETEDTALTKAARAAVAADLRFPEESGNCAAGPESAAEVGETSTASIAAEPAAIRERKEQYARSLHKIVEHLANDIANVRKYSLRGAVLQRLFPEQLPRSTLRFAGYDVISEGAAGETWTFDPERCAAKAAELREGGEGGEGGGAAAGAAAAAGAPALLQAVARAAQREADLRMDPNGIEMVNVMRMVKENRDLPGIELVPEEVYECDAAASVVERPKKPWEK